MSQVVSGQELAATSGEPGTELSTLLAGLSTPQQLALTALAEGKAYVEAAARAGVSRTTLWSWLKTNANFAAAYEAWQQELRESARARLLKLVDDAATLVTQAIEAGDAKVALRILRDLGVLGTGPARKVQQQSQPAAEPVDVAPPPAPPARTEPEIPPVPQSSLS